MTFYEAALEVLRQSGRPLHFKKITELAIRNSLLSHVGKTPEVTMSARLNQEVKREELSALMQPRPGIFLLKEDIAERLNEEAEERAKTDAEEAARLEEEARNNPQPEEDEEPEEDVDETDEYSSNHPRQERQNGNGRSRSRSRRRRRGGRRDEQDDAQDSSEDQSHKGKGDEDSGDDHAPTPERANNRSRRGGRSRGGRANTRSSSNDRSSNGRSSSRSSNGRSSRREEEETKEETTTESRNDNSSSRGSRDDNNKDSRGDKGSRRGGRSRSRRGGRSSSNRRDERKVETEELDQKHLEKGPVRLEGIAQAAHIVLQEADEIMEIEDLATAIFKRKLVKFHTHDPALTVQSALVNDNQLRHRRGHRELFVRHANKQWGLSEWGMTLQTLRKEQQILSISEECRQEALRLLGKTLLKVKTEALEQITLTMLEGLGYRNIKVSKRSSNGDVFFSADWRQGLSDMRMCIQLTGESEEELTREVVTELRGTLHHYAAHEGVIIHFGDIDKKAVEESREAKLANITLIDRKTFVELIVDQGIGVKRYHTPILVVDNAYIEELTN